MCLMERKYVRICFAGNFIGHVNTNDIFDKSKTFA